MNFITGTNRDQTYFTTLDDLIARDNPVRLIDGFLQKLDLQKIGFKKVGHKSEGRPPYEPAVLLKICMATSIKYAAAASCKKNVCVM